MCDKGHCEVLTFRGCWPPLALCDKAPYTVLDVAVWLRLIGSSLCQLVIMHVEFLIIFLEQAPWESQVSSRKPISGDSWRYFIFSGSTRIWANNAPRLFFGLPKVLRDVWLIFDAVEGRILQAATSKGLCHVLITIPSEVMQTWFDDLAS